MMKLYCKSCHKHIKDVTVQQIKNDNISGEEICPECAKRINKILSSVESFESMMNTEVKTTVEKIQQEGRRLIKMMMEPDETQEIQETPKPKTKPKTRKGASYDNKNMPDMRSTSEHPNP